MIELDEFELVRQQAIGKLVAMRQEINSKLAQFGHVDGEPITVAKKDRKPKTCGKCGAEGHTARKCPTPSA
jgi:Fe2+ transport system protein FeoA